MRRFSVQSRVLIALIVLCFITVMPQVRGWNEASRMALTQALVEDHSFSIDNSVFADTGDKVFIEGRYYSDKPPFPSMFAAIVYLPVHALDLELDYGWNAAYYLVILLTVKVFWIFGLLAFNGSLQFTHINDRHRLILVLALGLGSLYLTWSSTFNNHILAAASLSIALYYWLRSRFEQTRSALPVSGFFLLLAACMDLPTGIFYLGFLLVLLIQRRSLQAIGLFLLPLTVTVIPYMLINYSISGSILPVQWHQEHFNFPGSVWVDTGSRINSPLETLSYGLNSLVGLRGFIIYNPLLFIAFVMLYREWRSTTAYKAETVVVSLCSLVLMMFYFVFTSNYGGWSYSIRWFVPLLPLLYFFLYGFFQENQPGRQRVFLVLAGISVIISAVGLLNPWASSELSSIPFVSNLLALANFISG